MARKIQHDLNRKLQQSQTKFHFSVTVNKGTQEEILNKGNKV